MSDYTSSIINKYGDRDNVPKDCKTLFEIQARQGSSLLIDVIAESAGTVANKYKLSTVDREQLIKNLVAELTEALSERL